MQRLNAAAPLLVAGSISGKAGDVIEVPVSPTSSGKVGGMVTSAENIMLQLWCFYFY